MGMEVRDTGAAVASQVVSNIEAIRIKFFPEDGDGFSQKPMQGQRFLVGEIMEVFHMPLREYHQMAGVEGIEIDGYDETVTARNLKAPDIGIFVPDSAEDAFHLRLIPLDILKLIGIEKIVAHKDYPPAAATIPGVGTRLTIGSRAALLALFSFAVHDY
jgi:hypothetical protein